MISGVAENSGAFTNCSSVTAWNGYYCLNKDLGILLFESNDDDNMTRTVSPVNVISCNISARNVLNTMMDHHWDGFYTSMTRLARFPTLI